MGGVARGDGFGSVEAWKAGAMSDGFGYVRSLSLFRPFFLSTGGWIYEIVNFCSDLSQSGLDLC